VSLIYVTGISGAGKSAVCDELTARGYEAYDADRDGFKSWYDRTTDERAADQRRWSDATVEWRGTFWLKVDPEKVEALAERARSHGRPIFLCATTPGEDAFWHLLDKVIQLSIGEATLRRRIAARIDNDFGKDPADLEEILGWHATTDESMRSFGATLIDAERPLDEVVDDVLRIALEES